MFPMPSRKSRIQMYINRGMTPEAAREKVRRIEAASASAARLYRQKLAESNIKSERPGVYRLNPMDDNDPVFKLLGEALQESGALDSVLKGRK